MLTNSVWFPRAFDVHVCTACAVSRDARSKVDWNVVLVILTYMNFIAKLPFRALFFTWLSRLQASVQWRWRPALTWRTPTSASCHSSARRRATSPTPRWRQVHSACGKLPHFPGEMYTHLSSFSSTQITTFGANVLRSVHYPLPAYRWVESRGHNEWTVLFQFGGTTIPTLHYCPPGFYTHKHAGTHTLIAHSSARPNPSLSQLFQFFFRFADLIFILSLCHICTLSTTAISATIIIINHHQYVFFLMQHARTLIIVIILNFIPFCTSQKFNTSSKLGDPRGAVPPTKYILCLKKKKEFVQPYRFREEGDMMVVASWPNSI